jgi:hypothetical protein
MNLKSRILIVVAAWCLAGTSAADTTNYEYDNLHRLVHVTYESGAWIHYAYDAVGNRLLDVMNSTPNVGYVYVEIDPNGGGTVDRDPPGDWYAFDQNITLTPQPTGLCSFDHWSGDVPTGHETDDPLTITVGACYTHLVAHFSADHIDEDCDDDGVPDGCEWADTNSNGVLDDCDPLIDRSVLTLENECPWGENAPDQFFDVWNAGLPGTLLDYTIYCSDTWLSVTPSGGTSTGGHIAHTVHYQTTTLPVGEYEATITISDPGAGNNEQTIDVILEVTGRAAVCRDLQTLTAVGTYGEDAPDESFQVWNCGLPGTELHYTIEWSETWLWCEPPSGTLTDDEPYPITVHFDSADLPAGQHLATITVSDPQAAYSPRMVLVVLTIACPAEGWEAWDMNYDGMVSLIGDVPPFVDCVYFTDCGCPGPGCICPGDCNGSGFLSIVGDLQCFVDCVYFGDCEPQRGTWRTSLPGLFTVGGAVYSDLADPLGSGLADVTITVGRLLDASVEAEPAGNEKGQRDIAPAPASQARVLLLQRTRSHGDMGLWQIDNLPPGRYVVTASRQGYQFDHLEAGVVVPGGRMEIVVGPETEATNESIQFLAWP